MLIFLVVLWLLGVLARDDSRKDTKYVIKRIHSCPDVGYYFRREASPNTLDAVCYLCFCQNDGTAVCWQRENKRCDAAHYQHGVGKRDTRLRRSPVSFSDIFFRDAARDLFNTNLPETCKPYETSFSEGCPPADWCVGCTVCDCDANGRWDCHILSFCPDKKDKNKLKTTKKRIRDGVPKRTTVEVPKRTTNKNPPKRTPVPKKTTINTANLARKNIKHASPVKQPNKTTKQNKYMTPKNNKSSQKRSNTSPKPLIIKKEAKSKKPKVVKSQKSNPMKLTNKNETAVITQEIYKKVIAAMQTFLDKRISAAQPKPTVKSVQKRTMVKRSAKNIQNTKNAKRKVNGLFKPTANKNIYNPQNSKQKNIKNLKKPGKVNKKGGTTKKPTKPLKTNRRRNKRDVNDYNITETVKVENSSYKNTEVPVTIPPNSILVENETITNVSTTNDYYKYTMITPSLSLVTDNPGKLQIVYALAKNDTKDYQNITLIPKKRDKENRFDEIQAIILNSSAPDVKHETVLRKQKMSFDKDMFDFNDLKFNDWPQIKLLKNSILIKKLVGVNSTKKIEKTSNLTKENKELLIKKHLTEKDVERVVSLSSKKYNISKIINSFNCNTNNSRRRNQINFRERIYNKINDLQNVLKRVLVDVHTNNTHKTKPKPKRFNVIKYFKNFFSKMFRKYKHGKNTMNDQTELNNHIIDSICESFSGCNMAQKNNLVLRHKLRELNKESYSIIRTIKIIKGLLHLLDFPTNTKLIDDEHFKLHRAKSNLKDDIHKLNAVLKDKYTNNNNPLSSTQMTQIRYIKNNTQLFVQSVGKFANTLNEIITILTKKHNIEEKRKHTFKTAKKSYVNNIKRTNDTSGDFKRLKSLLVKYNLIQNTFVRNMYKLLSKYEEVHENVTNTKVRSEDKVTKATIEHFSRNIIYNLRRLKSLANVLNSNRQKRDTLRDDDAMEYLLTLMEYLLKQNYPLDAAPVNDGIDLLIEAIKSAPDIKPIKKKVLQSVPVNIRITRTTEPVPESMIKEDISYDSRRINDDTAVNDTKSENSENSRSENTRSETREQSSYQESEKDENFKYYPGKNIFEAAVKENTDVNYENRKTFFNPNQIDTTVIPGGVGIFGNVEETTEHNNLKFESAAKENKKFEVYNTDLDDEDVEVASTTITSELDKELDYAVTVTVPLETTEFKLADVKTKQTNINSVDISGNSDSEKRISLDWLDEGYDDIKEVRQTKKTMTTTTEAPVVTTAKAVHTDNVSGLSREVIGEEHKKRKSKINAEEVMFKKQMDLLNSLDYGTERTETDDVESKEGDERYSGDMFPSYFG